MLSKCKYVGRFSPATKKHCLGSVYRGTKGRRFTLITFLCAGSLGRVGRFSRLCRVRRLGPMDSLRNRLSRLRLQCRIENAPAIVCISGGKVVARCRVKVGLSQVGRFLFPMRWWAGVRCGRSRAVPYPCHDNTTKNIFG